MNVDELRIEQVVIVGGGTAGWLTACTLAKNLASTQPGAIQVCVVESPDIPTIGVGEGTWPTMRRTLENIGLDETEFIRECSATFKQGSQFINWKQSANTDQPHAYYNLFSSIYNPADFNLAPYWALGHAGSDITYANAVSAQGVACDRGLAPKKITTRSYDAVQSYAYHLDAGKFAELLKRHATEKLGVRMVAANVTQVNSDEDGFITDVDTKEHGKLSGQLFVDCTGFRSLLLGDALQIPFKDVNDVLLTDTAMAVQVPYASKDADIACVTKATAQEAGWIWDIGLQNRRGVGHVYSSAHISDEKAEQQLRTYCDDLSGELSVRKIKMRVGYREKFWHKNCVAIGLSAAFVEPLEASAIFLVEAAGNMLSDLFPRTRRAMAHTEKKFNNSFRFRWDKTIDFIKLHYYLSSRQDPFWRENKQSETVPDSLLEKLDAWSQHPISKYDFSDTNEPFPHESYQYILHGMGFEQSLQSSAPTFAQVAQAKMYFANVVKATEHICRDLPSHRSLIDKVCQYGFQKI